MMDFKTFIEVSTGLPVGSFREKKLFSPPAYQIIPPHEHKKYAQQWLVRIYYLLIHMAEAEELIMYNNKVYALKSVVDLKWHPSSIEAFRHDGVLKNVLQKIPVTIPKAMPDGTTKPVTMNAEVYEIDVNLARQKLEMYHSKFNTGHDFKAGALNLWRQMNIGSVPKFQGTEFLR